MVIMVIIIIKLIFLLEREKIALGHQSAKLNQYYVVIFPAPAGPGQGDGGDVQVGRQEQGRCEIVDIPCLDFIFLILSNFSSSCCVLIPKDCFQALALCGRSVVSCKKSKISLMRSVLCCNCSAV